MLRLSILALCIVTFISCSNAPAPDEESALQPQKVDAPQSSGKTLKGEFVLKPAEDDYAITVEPRAVIRFDEEGNFRRQQFSGGAIAEEGGYIISTANELVLYVEKVADEQLESAVMEKYSIMEQSDSRLKLQADRAGTFILEKKQVGP